MDISNRDVVIIPFGSECRDVKVYFDDYCEVVAGSNRYLFEDYHAQD